MEFSRIGGGTSGGSGDTFKKLYDLIGTKASSIHGHTWSEITDKPTTLSGMGVSLVTSDIPAMDASKITTGVFDIARIPAAALERMITVANQSARFALTTTQVQNGDCVRQADTNIMYWVIDSNNLGNTNGYAQYNAGTAASVPWSGVTSPPTTLAGYGISATDTLLTSNFAPKNNPIFTGIVLAENTGFGITKNGKKRFLLGSDGVTEGGNNTGSNLSLYRYNDAGDYLGLAVNINRGSGNVGLNSNSPYAKLEVGIDDIVTSTGVNLAFSLLATKSPNADRLSMGWLGEDSWGIFSSDQNGYKNLCLQPWGGNVGVGWSSPEFPLDVTTTRGDGISGRFTSAPNFYGVYLGTNTSSGYGMIHGALGQKPSKLLLNPNGTNVGVGLVSDPQANLHTAGNTILGAINNISYSMMGNNQLGFGIDSTGALYFYTKDGSGNTRTYVLSNPAPGGTRTI